MRKISKEKAFDILWVKYNYCMMGYNRKELYNSMSGEEIRKRLEDEVDDEMWKGKL